MHSIRGNLSTCIVGWIKKTTSTVAVNGKYITYITGDIVKTNKFHKICVPQFAVQGPLAQCLFLKSAKAR